MPRVTVSNRFDGVARNLRGHPAAARSLELRLVVVDQQCKISVTADRDQTNSRSPSAKYSNWLTPHAPFLFPLSLSLLPSPPPDSSLLQTEDGIPRTGIVIETHYGCQIGRNVANWATSLICFRPKNWRLWRATLIWAILFIFRWPLFAEKLSQPRGVRPTASRSGQSVNAAVCSTVANQQAHMKCSICHTDTMSHAVRCCV